MRRVRLLYAVGFGYLGDLVVGWLAMWLAPHTNDLTFRIYMGPAEWFVSPLKAPFLAMVMWTLVIGAAYYVLAPKPKPR